MGLMSIIFPLAVVLATIHERMVNGYVTFPLAMVGACAGAILLMRIIDMVNK